LTWCYAWVGVLALFLLSWQGVEVLWRVPWRWDLVFCHGTEFPVVLAPFVLEHPAFFVFGVEESEVPVDGGEAPFPVWPDLVFEEALDEVGSAAAVESIFCQV
jgi:hypothetical protein